MHDFLDFGCVLNEGNDAHSAVTLWALQRVNFIDSLNTLRPSRGRASARSSAPRSA